MKTIAAPDTSPAMAPSLVVLFQKSEKSIRGPNAAPKPAQAKLTIVKITLSSSSAIIAPKRAIRMSVMRLTLITLLSSAFFLKIP